MDERADGRRRFSDGRNLDSRALSVLALLDPTQKKAATTTNDDINSFTVSEGIWRRYSAAWNIDAFPLRDRERIDIIIVIVAAFSAWGLEGLVRRGPSDRGYNRR